ncbi:hypothetical protein BD410DRAFT_720031 [Rickenella mellea]|uniref:Peptidase S28 n=1 Tax=Rickenella mellea TaxID=50990 RepID=A0A4Y7Q8A9_9AGAM|nr:hypothetical protein BD410DRAFT_720031 [Rickenella mellea]
MLKVLLAFTLATGTAAVLRDGRLHGNIAPLLTVPKVTPPATPVTSRNGTTLPSYDTVYMFDQLIDHNNPSLGTFKQRFWHTYEYYEPGGPIIFFTPGEVAADGYQGYLTNLTINGLIAQQQNGSTIVLEHRFFGLSYPKDDLTVESLSVLNIQQAIDDVEYFAKSVKLPMPGGDQVTPDTSPWIMIGGSYSGALTSWTMVTKPGLFWAGYASSATVECIEWFWQYFEPIRQFMPQNCSADVQAVIKHIDDTFTSGNATMIDEIKNLFGLGNVTHLDDVAGALRYNLFDWQALQPSSGPGLFDTFCDKLEVHNGVSAPEYGWGVDIALNAWGSYWTDTYYEILCGDDNAEDCLGTYNSSDPYWTNTAKGNDYRAWTWIVCNEIGLVQEGAPEGTPSIVTRLLKPSYDERQCTYWFPEIYPDGPRPPKTNATNSKTQGWDVAIDRLFFANGKRDPWRDATVSSDFHMRQSTSSQPIAVSDGFHCSDLLTNNNVDSSVDAVQKQGLAAMKTWLAQWTPSNSTS